MVMIALAPTMVLAADVRVTIDGQPVEFPVSDPVILDNRTLVPIRPVFEALGFYVSWEQTTQTATLVRHDFTVIIAIGSDVFTTNGQPHTLDVSAQNINASTKVPIRAVLESVGYEVAWDSSTRTVIITTPLPSFTIPNRRLTAEEAAEWISVYDALGGMDAFELEVVRLVNVERAARGLNPLEVNYTLMMSSRFKSQSMYDLSYFSHISPAYGTSDIILREVFEFQWRNAFGENIGWGQPPLSPEAVVQAWMNSPNHRDNILSPNFTQIGVGQYDIYWTQQFSG